MLPLLSRFSHVRLCDPVNCRPPGSSVHGILQARILEWAAVPSSTEADSLPLNHQGSPYMCVCVCVVPRVLGNKLPQKDHADSGVRFITPAGPRQSLRLAKDPDQFL